MKNAYNLKQLNVENYTDISLGINNTYYIFTPSEIKTLYDDYSGE
jgi:hypothetical protein